MEPSMTIERVIIRNFKGLKETDLTFGKGINILVGTTKPENRQFSKRLTSRLRDNSTAVTWGMTYIPFYFIS